MTETIVVTGASRGIGRYCAERLQKTGYRVIGLARTQRDEAPFDMRLCDVTDVDSVKAAFADLRRDRSLCALINAAGVASMNLTLTTPADTVRRIVETNLVGTIYCCQAAVPSMIRRGNGRVVNFSTIAVPLALKGEAPYVASKAGVEGFTRTFAREMADHGITVNAIAPGPIKTDLISKVPQDKIDDVVRQQILQRQAEPEDVFDLITLLLSAQSSMITGEVLHLGGA